MNCPDCGTLLSERGERYPECPDCGFTLFDAESLALQAEVQAEQKLAKQIYGHIPTFEEWNRR